MHKIKRVILIVLDGVGVGELPDAAEYGDEYSNSLGNTANVVGGFNLPTLEIMGLGNLTEIKGVNPRKTTIGSFGKMAERSKGKDSIIGHWEIMGIYSPKSLPIYPNGFPKTLIDKFEKLVRRKVIGNKPASGTEIIKELGEEHLRTGNLIIYTSSDSVFQIAAHEEIIPIEKLYNICELARSILIEEHAVGRVIARPFRGQPGAFYRTEHRRDWSLNPPRKTLLDYLSEAGFEVVAIGKIDQIFSFHGITTFEHTANNIEGINAILAYMKKNFNGLVFANLGDFDTIYGHRNNPGGYAGALEVFDTHLEKILTEMKNDDMLIITSDHGNDPTTPSTDHSREYVPLLIVGKFVKPGVNLGIRITFADVAATISHLFNLPSLEIGTSFKNTIINN